MVAPVATEAESVAARDRERRDANAIRLHEALIAVAIAEAVVVYWSRVSGQLPLLLPMTPSNEEAGPALAMLVVGAPLRPGKRGGRGEMG